MPALLLHGPGAQQEAEDRAERLGRLLIPPVGALGLKTDEAREAIKLMSSTVIGSQLGVLIVGPVDGIRSEATDVLLKPLEEYDALAILPILWARDAGEVSDTIRSRCFEEWCPYGADPDAPFLDAAVELCKAAIKQDWYAVVEKLDEHKGYERELLAACAAVLARAKGAGWVPLWLGIRSTLRYPNLSKVEALAALLGGA